MRRQGTKGSVVITDLAKWTFDNWELTQHYANELAKAMELSYNLDVFERMEMPEEDE